MQRTIGHTARIRRTRSREGLAFSLFMRAIAGGLIGGALMICYAMINQHIAHADIWVPLRAIGATFLGDKGVDDPSLTMQGVILGAVIHATNAVIFGMILSLIVIVLSALVPLPEHLLLPIVLVGAVLYALTVMVVMQNVIVPTADPVFSEYTSSQAQFTVEHILYGLSVGLLLVTALRARRVLV